MPSNVKTERKKKGEQAAAGQWITGLVFLLFEVDPYVFPARGWSRLGPLCRGVPVCSGLRCLPGRRTLLLPHKPSPALLSNVSYLKKEDNKSGLKFLQDFDILLHAGVVETHSQDQHCTKGEPQEHRQSRWWRVIYWTV